MVSTFSFFSFFWQRFFCGGGSHLRPETGSPNSCDAVRGRYYPLTSFSAFSVHFTDDAFSYTTDISFAYFYAIEADNNCYTTDLFQISPHHCRPSPHFPHFLHEPCLLVFLDTTVERLAAHNPKSSLWDSFYRSNPFPPGNFLFALPHRRRDTMTSICRMLSCLRHHHRCTATTTTSFSFR